MDTAFRISNFTVQNEVKEFNTQNVLTYIITLNIALSESHINHTFRGEGRLKKKKSIELLVMFFTYIRFYLKCVINADILSLHSVVSRGQCCVL